ncbi:membrane hypothetical protein [Candidatus Sulfotelmatobacter sp. SbA7]|jgi:hypothetical protein|nr:membrane hypothetical protein [Candidatus Sulfotelmatobacter sp. SbA7]
MLLALTNPIRKYKWSFLSVSSTLVSFGIYSRLQNAGIQVGIIAAIVFVASLAFAVVALRTEPILRYGIVALGLCLINFLIHASG